nr:hypothetical protein [Streptomyces sp. PsTaAH-124]
MAQTSVNDGPGVRELGEGHRRENGERAQLVERDPDHLAVELAADRVDCAVLVGPGIHDDDVPGAVGQLVHGHRVDRVPLAELSRVLDRRNQLGGARHLRGRQAMAGEPEVRDPALVERAVGAAPAVRVLGSEVLAQTPGNK